MEFVCNKKLTCILEQAKKCKCEYTIDDDKLKKLMNPVFEKIFDCIIVKSGNVKVTREQFLKCVHSYGDKTGYEVGSNEILINCYASNKLTDAAAAKLALYVIKVWFVILKSYIGDEKICFIIDVSNIGVLLRFHKLRDNEFWLCSDLEVYENPIGYVIMNGDENYIDDGL